MEDLILKVVKALKQLQPEDMRVLNAIERGMALYEIVPFDQIVRLSGLSPEEVSIRLRKLHKLDLIRRSLTPYLGYVLKVAGYDCLALNALSKANILYAIGRKLGVGKEADVYDALTPAGTRVAVKFHRLGRTSFRQTRRFRVYVGDRRHISWLYQSRLAAEREYEALRLVFPKGVHAPKPIGHNRHVVVTSIIEGAPLNEIKDLPNPKELLEAIIEDVRIAYQEAGVIHGDLSEYNIIVDLSKDELTHVIIDWPQWVSTAHPSAEELLRRDLRNVIAFFKRKYDVYMELDEALEYVRS
ncbi:MAG: serine/threonine protein kinase [Thermoprotei archaeon]|nr:MAG: serine/threonine protein kinase [Thermoprotei archaeon]